MYYLFASDFHNDWKALKNALDFCQEESEHLNLITLVLLGDYLDGYSTKDDIKQMVATLEELQAAKDNYVFDIRFVRGNHDQFILGTSNLDELDYKTWLINGGKETLRGMGYHNSLNSIHEIASYLQHAHSDLLDFIRDSNEDWEDRNFYAVHGGLDLDINEPRNTEFDDKLWLRDDYYFNSEGSVRWNTLYKPIISGHTPVMSIYPDKEDNSPVILKADVNDTPRYIIDGGSNSGDNRGGVNGVLFNDKGKLLTTLNLSDPDFDVKGLV